MNIFYFDPDDVWLPDPILKEREDSTKKNKFEITDKESKLRC
jgi:hypothetical protein